MARIVRRRAGTGEVTMALTRTQPVIHDDGLCICVQIGNYEIQLTPSEVRQMHVAVDLRRVISGAHAE